MITYRKKVIVITQYDFQRYVEIGKQWLESQFGLVFSSVLAHIGNENSGRYPRGSGDRPYQHVKKSPQEYEITDQETGERFHLAEGERIRNPKVFAGKGTKFPLRDVVAEGLAERYGGEPENWKHAKGFGVIDFYGKDREAEIHWFEEESVGKFAFKIKHWIDD